MPIIAADINDLVLNMEDHYHPLFWNKVNKNGENGCWLWTAALDKDGYGLFSIHRRQFRVHRISYILKNGAISTKIQVLHKCDCSSCCNPDHLFLGNQLDNMADKVGKNRQAKGEKHGFSKLTNKEICEIRYFIDNRIYTQCQLADMYGVSQSLISYIKLREIWTHV